MIVELLTDLEAWAAIEPAWQRLAMSRGNLFIGPDWAHAATSELIVAGVCVAVARDERGTVGVMPLAGRIGRRGRLRFMGSEVGDRFEPACDPACEAEFCQSVAAALEEQSPGTMLVFDHVEADAFWWRHFETRGKHGLSAISQRESSELYIDLNGLDWAGYLATRSKSFRKRIAYIERALGRDHRVAFRETDSADSLSRDLNLFFELHDRRWQERGGSSLVSEHKRAFLRSLAARLLEKGQLRLRFLEVDGKAVAALFAWRFGDRYCYYQGGFDPAWAKQSVGMLIVADTVRSAIAEGASEFDFLLGEESYKHRFATDSRTVTTAVLVGSQRPARLLAMVEAWLRRRLVGREHPILKKLAAYSPSRR